MKNDCKNSKEVENITVNSIMSHEDGRHFIWRILEQAGLFSDDFDVDPCINARNMGRRSIALWLQNELNIAAPDFYLKMIKEHLHE